MGIMRRNTLKTSTAVDRRGLKGTWKTFSCSLVCPQHFTSISEFFGNHKRARMFTLPDMDSKKLARVNEERRGKSDFGFYVG